MERQEIEKKLIEFGFAIDNSKKRMFESHPTNYYSFDADAYALANGGEHWEVMPISFYINDASSLFATQLKYVVIETDKYGITIRLYCDHYYIGCIVKSWDEIQSFEIEMS